MTKYSKVSLPATSSESTTERRAQTARIVRPVPTNSEGDEPIFDLGPTPNSKNAALVLAASAFEESDVANFLARGKTCYTAPGKTEPTYHPDESIVRINGDYPVPLVAQFRFKEIPGTKNSEKVRFFVFIRSEAQEALEILEEKLGFKLITSPQPVDQTTALALTTVNLPVPKSNLRGIFFFQPGFSEENGMVWKFLKPGDTCFINFQVKIVPESTEAFAVIKKMVKVDKRELSTKYKTVAREESPFYIK